MSESTFLSFEPLTVLLGWLDASSGIVWLRENMMNLETYTEDLHQMVVEIVHQLALTVIEHP